MAKPCTFQDKILNRIWFMFSIFPMTNAKFSNNGKEEALSSTTTRILLDYNPKNR